MALLNLLLIIFQGCLAVYLLTLLWFMLGLFRREPRRSPRQPPVSVIVAVRAGHPNFHLLLEQLQAQDYPPDRLECIIVDDGLDASSRALVDDVAARQDNFQVVASSRGDPALAHKKRALDGGIRASTGELLLFTDADCQVGPRWVSGLVSYFLNEVDYVVGWSQVAASARESWATEITAAKRPLTLFEQLDFALLMLAARGATLMGTPWASSGQNQAYRRALYDAVGGFHDLAGQLQGDDTLFLQLARRSKAGARVAFATDPHTRVVTAPAPSTAHFLAQRIRWAADVLATWRYNPAFFLIALAALGVNLLFIALLPIALASPTVVLSVLIPAVLLKAGGEAVLLLVGAGRASLGNLKRHFPLWFLLQIPYVAVVGLGAFWGNRLPWRRPLATQ